MDATRTKRDIGIAAVVGAALLAIAFIPRGQGQTQAQAKAGTQEIRLAHFPNLTHGPALVAVAKNMFSENPGISVSTKVVNAGPEAMEALLAGAVDAAYVGPSPAINTFVKTNGEAVRIISGVCTGGASLVARPEANIHSIKDLSGKRVAVPQLGGTQDVSCRHFLAEAGLATKDLRGTVEIIPAKNPDILALFKQKQIDAAWVPEPWASRLRSDAGAETVVDERDLWPEKRFTTTVLVVSTKFADAHPEAAAALVRTNKQAIDWMVKNPVDAQKLVNDELKRLTGKALKDDVLKEAWGKVEFSDPVDMPNILAMADAAAKAGYLNLGSVDLTTIVASEKPNTEKPK